MGLITLGWGAATVYLYQHPSDVNYATWGTITATIICAYRWIDYKDSKIPDAQ